ncbi:MAG TPA: DNA-directed RNA polymerase subunit beta', partial [Bacillota bacterium]
AQAEARILMLSTHNILNPKDGKPVVTPTQDMVLGSYYLTLEKEPPAQDQGGGEEGTKPRRAFASADEVIMAYETGQIGLHEPIVARVRTARGIERLATTPGRVIFNEHLPVELRFVNTVVDRSVLGRIVADAFRRLGYQKTAEMLDALKELGFHYATRAGVTISVSDVVVPEQKPEIIKRAEQQVEEIERQYQKGLLTREERYQKVIETWSAAKDELTRILQEKLDTFNPIRMMAISGARGNWVQISQLGGMRGLMADPSGRTIELPVRANFREGLTVLEYFISTHGARKGLADTALRTADSGYLTRRLVDVSQDVIVREVDCGTTQGIKAREIRDGEEVIEPLTDRIIGRLALRDIKDPATGEVIVRADEEITEEAAAAIVAAGIEEVEIRSVLTCRSKFGVCSRCYGRDLATGRLVEVGEAVGIIAAQSIGEPGTQLTMRTFHTGGVAGEDITQGLPRVEELFEARKPKGQAIICENEGTVKIVTERGRREIRVYADDETYETYVVPFGSRIRVRDGDRVAPGDELTEGSANPHDILKVKGVRGVQLYLLQEVQRVYRMQGVEINDKHIEIIIRQMMRKVKVEDAGDTGLLPGGLVDMLEFEEINQRVREQGGRPATARPVLLGITKASLATDSFLSAASFQETTRVLTEASIKGKVDPLVGLKENVIIGKLIPAGTGMARYRQLELLTPGAPQKQLAAAMSGNGRVAESDAPAGEGTDRVGGDGVATATAVAGEADGDDEPTDDDTL